MRFTVNGCGCAARIVIRGPDKVKGFVKFGTQLFLLSAGIQSIQVVTEALDSGACPGLRSGVHRSDDFLRIHQGYLWRGKCHIYESESRGEEKLDAIAYHMVGKEEVARSSR